MGFLTLSWKVNTAALPLCGPDLVMKVAIVPLSYVTGSLVHPVGDTLGKWI